MGGFICKEDYKEKMLQQDGETEKAMDIWEGAGLKSAIETGKKPEWGMWLAGKKSNVSTFPVLFCQKPKGGVLIAQSGSQIVAGFYDEEKGQTAGNCKKAVTDFVVYLKGIGY